jgi:polyisoprenoid-binding protein YceI
MTTQRWNIDTTHSAIQFTVRHMVVAKVRGRFTRWDGSIQFDEQDPAASSVEVTIDASSIETNEPKRDAHLRSADFFDVEKFKELTFRSKKVLLADSQLTVLGELTIHGVTREVVLEGEYVGTQKDPYGGTRVGFSAKTTINRKDYGLHWNVALEAGGVLVGDKVEIALDVEAVAADATVRKAG